MAEGGEVCGGSPSQDGSNSMNLNDIADEVYDIATSKGWHDNPNETEDQYVERCCNNLHDEVSELHTAWRENHLHDPCDKADKMREIGTLPLTCLEEELADIIIRACDDAVHLGVDIEAVTLAKMAFNKTRPHRHGGKRS